MRLIEHAKATSNNEPEEKSLDFYEAFALMYCIAHTYYFLKIAMSQPPEIQALNTPECNAGVEAMYYTNEEQAKDVLWRITEKMGYMDYGLQILEEIFELKPAVRTIKADNIKKVAEITINKDNSNLFLWIFQWLDLLEHYQDEWEFAYNFYHCRYIHLNDYKALRKKLENCQQGDNIPFTLYDTVVLYLTLSLSGRMFASDAAEILDIMEKDLEPQPGITVTMKDMRNFFLKFGSEYLELIKNLHSKNAEFIKYIAVTDSWEI